MADIGNQPSSHLTNLKGKIRIEASAPTNPLNGDMYFNSSTGYLMYYNGSSWIGAKFTRA